jgi:hypothetical protein
MLAGDALPACRGFLGGVQPFVPVADPTHRVGVDARPAHSRGSYHRGGLQLNKLVEGRLTWVGYLRPGRAPGPTAVIGWFLNEIHRSRLLTRAKEVI